MAVVPAVNALLLGDGSEDWFVAGVPPSFTNPGHANVVTNLCRAHI